MELDDAIQNVDIISQADTPKSLMSLLIVRAEAESSFESYSTVKELLPSPKKSRFPLTNHKGKICAKSLLYGTYMEPIAKNGIAIIF